MFQLFSELFTANFTGKSFCNEITVSQFVEIDNATVAQMMDELFCETDWQAIAQELNSDRVNSAVGAAVSHPTHSTPTNLSVTNTNSVNILH